MIPAEIKDYIKKEYEAIRDGSNTYGELIERTKKVEREAQFSNEHWGAILKEEFKKLLIEEMGGLSIR